MGGNARSHPGDDEIIAQHSAALSNTDERVRATAMDELAYSGSAQAVDALIPLLQDSVASVRAHALYALGHLEDQRAAAAVLPLLSDPIPLVRMEAAVTIGRFAYRPALEPLLTLLSDDDVGVRTFASHYGFGLLGEAALPHLLDAVTDARSSVRACAAMALGTLVSVDALGAVSEDERRERCPYALSDGSKAEAVTALLAAAVDEDLGVRLSALDGLSRHGDPRAAAVLLPALTDPDPSIRAGAVEGLHQCGIRTAVPLLMRLLREDDSPAVRLRTLTALGDLADPHAHLGRALQAVRDHDRDADVRSEAARVVARLQRKHHA